MARTQILKDIRPNIFLYKRKVFGILFLFLIQIISAHVGIGTIPKYDFEEETMVSDSIISDHKDSVQSKVEIYITAGTTIIDLENAVEGKIVVVKSPNSNDKHQSIAKKNVLEKSVKPIETKKYVAKHIQEHIYPSSQTNVFYSISESITKAVVSSKDFHSKFLLKPIIIFGSPIFENLKNSIYSDIQNIRIEFWMLFSGRAPPAFI
ncbi:hypothetical protein [Epilithonimonas xixisoli]|nr:hypothetical protein [Epilithonimonas xixisoli]